MKELLAAIAVLITFVAYVPYIRDTLKGKTQPHAYSWLVWGLVTIVIFALQISHDAGAGAYVTLASAIALSIVFLLSLKYGKQHITQMDTALLVLALLAIGIWLVADQPVLSICLLVSIEMLGFAPTVRKSWNRPNSETLIMYQAGAWRQFLSIMALQSYTFITLVAPTTWFVANSLFTVMLIVRRRQVRSQ
ncbi:MAG: hypothetical protein AAB436_02010 [Patescibacteria group bacterium]